MTPMEVTSHTDALRYAAAMSAAATDTATSLDQTITAMREHHIGDDALTHLDRARAEAGHMGQQLRAAEAILRGHDIVAEGYAAAPDAGDKTWTTGVPDNVDAAASPASSAGPAPVATVDDEQERERIRVDRRAKADVIIPVSQLLTAARNIADALDDDDPDNDPEDLLRRLLDAINTATSEVGLGEVSVVGATTMFDPDHHHLLGEQPPDHRGRVQVQSPGQQWNHGGEQLVIQPAMVVPYDDQRGAYVLCTPSSLDEEGSGERIWLDDEVGEVPGCYREPGWYTVESVADCDGTDEDCPRRGSECGGFWIYLYDTDPGESEGIHYAGDAPVIMDYN